MNTTNPSADLTTFTKLAATVLIFILMGCTHPNQRDLYSKVWSGRVDGAIEFHVATRPEARYLLLVPPDYAPTKKYELWITLHGIAGASEDALCEWYWYAKQRQVILLAPQGVHQIRNRKTPHLAYWEYDKDPQAIVQVIDEVCENYHVEGNKLVVFGTSAGAELAMSLVSRIPERTAFLGLYGYGWSKELSVATFTDIDNLRRHAPNIALFLGRGLNDEKFKNDGTATADALRSIGFRVKAVAWPGLEHDDRDFRDETLRYWDAVRGHPQKEPSWTFDLAGKWRAKFVDKIKADGVCHDDPGPSAEARSATLPKFDDKTWQEVPVPMWRTKWVGDWSGDRWSGDTVMRKDVSVPNRLGGRDLIVNLGLVESLDYTYFNGVEVGRTTTDDPYWLWKPRTYAIPGKLVRPGRNVLSVRFFDRCGGGGITHAGPGELRVSAQ